MSALLGGKKAVGPVAGINHFVKIKTGANEYVHATIWDKAVGNAAVTHAEAGKAESDPL